jgi:hypothetical protein
VHEQVAAHRKAVPRLSRLQAQHVGVEQAQPLLVQRPDAVKHRALEQQAEAAQALGLQPLALVLLAEPVGEGVHRLGVHQPLAPTVRPRACFGLTP